MNRETMDDISAMRYGMESALQDLKWTERFVLAGGDIEYLSPGNSVSCVILAKGTGWAMGYDNTEAYPTVTYATFAHGDTWKEFERALYLAQAIEEEKPGLKQDLIGKWWDSWIASATPSSDRAARREWFRSRELDLAPAASSADAWRVLSGFEREAIEREVLKGITK